MSSPRTHEFEFAIHQQTDLEERRLMSPRYEAVITGSAGHLEATDVEKMQAVIDRHGLTHCQALDGKVWKIFSQLNQKSVPLNHAGSPHLPQRLPYHRVESIGRLVEEERDAAE